jgi:hypothetical protein
LTSPLATLAASSLPATVEEVCGWLNNSLIFVIKFRIAEGFCEEDRPATKQPGPARSSMPLASSLFNKAIAAKITTAANAKTKI